MTKIAGVRFKTGSKIYYFDPGELDIPENTQVIVETSRGVECGDCPDGVVEIPEEEIYVPLKRVLRVATPEDLRRVANNRRRETEALRICEEKILHHGLEMKLVDVECSFEGTHIVFYFTAEGRVDFRELVRDLASVLHTRIELRQIGVRDEAKMLGGLASCGRPLCCSSFLSDFHPVSIRMAKDQGISLNPQKISGMCGRLMCCLQYENDIYEKARKGLPKLNREVITPDGVGTVFGISVLKEKIKVKIALPDNTYDVREYDLSEVSKPPQPSTAPPKPARGKAERGGNTDRTDRTTQAGAEG